MKKARATANERRLMWAVVAFSIVCAAGVTVVLVHLWSTIDQNVAGWITTFVVLGAAFLVWEAFGLDDAFSRAGRRAQRLVIVLVLLLALGGSLAYVFWPGTASWYLAALPGIPLVLVLLSFEWRGEHDLGPLDLGDGPWTAP